MYNSSVSNNLQSPTREDYLESAIALLAPDFASHGAIIPACRVSVGWPAGTRKAIGQHWHPRASSDGVSQIFISPSLEQASQALEVLVHELIHAVYPNDGHGKKFGALARALGLEGKLTATCAGDALKKRLNEIERELGQYPHAKLNPLLSGQKKQGTRLIKVECCDCGYTFRAAKKWIDVGLPICVCGGEMAAEGGDE